VRLSLTSCDAARLLAELGAHLVDDGLPLAGAALTLEVPHPLIARRTWHVRTKPYSTATPSRKLVCGLMLTPMKTRAREKIGYRTGSTNTTGIGPMPLSMIKRLSADSV
jgi:hypothetical protein